MSLKKDLIEYLSFDRIYLNDVKQVFEKTTLNEAIEKAAKAVDPSNDKMFSHQRRVGAVKTAEGHKKLKDKDFKACKTFEDIIAITDEVKNTTKGLGDLWSYDTALRIGFQKKVYPKKVYIQAGVKKGYKKILNQNPKNRFEEKNKFPKELQILEPYEIENFLCIWGNNKQKNQSC